MLYLPHSNAIGTFVWKLQNTKGPGNERFRTTQKSLKICDQDKLAEISIAIQLCCTRANAIIDRISQVQNKTTSAVVFYCEIDLSKHSSVDMENFADASVIESTVFRSQ